jgi:TonB family protein
MATHSLEHAVPPGLTFPAVQRMHAAPVAQRAGLRADPARPRLLAAAAGERHHAAVAALRAHRQPDQAGRGNQTLARGRAAPAQAGEAAARAATAARATCRAGNLARAIAGCRHVDTPGRPRPLPPCRRRNHASTPTLDNPKPPYPPLSRRMGEQGRVVLRVHVTPEGAAGEVLLHASSGSPRLDESALATVRRWKFVPARRGAEPVAAWVLVPISPRFGVSHATQPGLRPLPHPGRRGRPFPAGRCWR